MSGRMSAEEMADMMGLKPNQRCRMAAWLRKNNWKYEIDANGLPIVLYSYRDRRLNPQDDKTPAKYSDGPNRNAFA